jgi:excisionase family DNA binding protein
MNFKLLTVTETAEALRIKPATVRAWVLRRKINSYRVGRAVRIGADAVDQVLRNGLRPAIQKEVLYGQKAYTRV